MMWQEEGCIMYELFVVNLSVFFVSGLYALLKPKNFFFKKPSFFPAMIMCMYFLCFFLNYDHLEC